MVALSGGPEGETLIRRAARIAARSGGDLLAVHATRPGRPAGSSQSVLAAQRQLAESAGGTYHQLADEDIPAALLAFAHAHDATQLVLGATRRTWRTALRPAASIRSQVIRRGGGLDVHIVTCTPSVNGDEVLARQWPPVFLGRGERDTVIRGRRSPLPDHSRVPAAGASAARGSR